MAENKEITAMNAIKESKQMMEGHKMDLFIILLQFLGLSILASILTLGIGFLFLMPLYYLTMANFYRELKGDQDELNLDDNFVLD